MKNLEKKLKNSLNNFMAWLNTTNNISFDVNDVWSTKLSINIKEFYLRNRLLGLLPMSVLHFSDILTPSFFTFLYKKKRYPIADAHLLIGFLNLYKYYDDKIYLYKAKQYLDSLINSSSSTKNGIGWGQPYTWVTPGGTLPPNNPVITTTSYCYDALKMSIDFFDDKPIRKILKDIVSFVLIDLKGNKINNDEEDSKYGYNYDYKCYNAIAYRAALLMEHYEYRKENNLYDNAMKNLNHIINNQQEDGSWLYSNNSLFIDNIHTCFILKKLIKCYLITRNEKILNSINKGYSYYINNFIRVNGTLKHFVKVRIPKFRKIEIYDYAEALNLEIQMNKIREPSFDQIKSLTNQLINDFQTNKGYFITRINTLNFINKVPYLGWPQSQVFSSLTKLLSLLNK